MNGWEKLWDRCYILACDDARDDWHMFRARRTQADVERNALRYFSMWV